MSDDDAPPTREDLLEAREQLKEQIARVLNPIRFTDQNPALVARLRAMLDDINNALAEFDDSGKRK
ncbi:MAG TPA: hypothetical protein VGH02_02945 [Rhizomicrobium sp.]|jgi:hypothetical protein